MTFRKPNMKLMSSAIRMAAIAAIAVCGMACLSCCGTPRPTSVAPCISTQQQDLMVRWGTEHDTANTVEAYELNAKGELFRYEGDKSDTTLKRRYLVAVDQTMYCDVTKNVQNTFLKVQALNVRGNRGRFIEYVNATRNVYLRAVWNPDLQTFQSRDMREQYDALMQLVPR